MIEVLREALVGAAVGTSVGLFSAFNTIRPSIRRKRDSVGINNSGICVAYYPSRALCLRFNCRESALKEKLLQDLLLAGTELLFPETLVAGTECVPEI